MQHAGVSVNVQHVGEVVQHCVVGVCVQHVWSLADSPHLFFFCLIYLRHGLLLNLELSLVCVRLADH